MSNWYSDSREHIQAIYGKDWKLFCGLLAATSPRASLKANHILALRAYNQFKANGRIETGSFMRTHRQQIERVLQGLEPRGQKVNAFYHNLIGDEGQVTLDRWMARAYNLPTDAISSRQYSDISNHITIEATKARLSPAQYQADIWLAQSGNKISYANVCNQYRMF